MMMFLVKMCTLVCTHTTLHKFNLISNFVDVPPFPPECFDKILLDAPCSALGQRPQFSLSQSLRDLQSYPQYQRMMLNQVHTIHYYNPKATYETLSHM